MANGSTTLTWAVYLVIRQERHPQMTPNAAPPRETVKKAPMASKYCAGVIFVIVVNSFKVLYKTTVTASLRSDSPKTKKKRTSFTPTCAIVWRGLDYVSMDPRVRLLDKLV